jgi:hypothetical protein
MRSALIFGEVAEGAVWAAADPLQMQARRRIDAGSEIFIRSLPSTDSQDNGEGP